MTDVKEDLERKAFEEWYCSSISESIGLERYPNGCYCNPEAENMYLAWCAAKSHAEKPKWISVEDRLPDYKNETEQFMTICQWEDHPNTYFYRVQRLVKISKHIYFDNEPCNAKTIFWQPLPAPPTTTPAA